MSGADHAIEITFSELAQYYGCGAQYRLRTLIGFQPPLVARARLRQGRPPHAPRQVSEQVRRYGREADSDAARPALRRRLLPPGRQQGGPPSNEDTAPGSWSTATSASGITVSTRAWEVERPFELHLGDAVVVGRADVILDDSDGKERLTIVDYKTADGEGEHHQFQLQVYTDAGRREGLTVDRAFVHDLRSKETSNRIPVPVDGEDVQRAEDLVRELIGVDCATVFEAKPERERCSHCDVRAMCADRGRLTRIDSKQTSLQLACAGLGSVRRVLAALPTDASCEPSMPILYFGDTRRLRIARRSRLSPSGSTPSLRRVPRPVTPGDRLPWSRANGSRATTRSI